jgi:hypothetical protein
VADINPEDVFEVTAIEDQQPVETLAANGADEALGNCVRLRRTNRGLNDSDPFAAEDLFEWAAVLTVAVPDQEADAPV